jgi:hypothetical protein
MMLHTLKSTMDEYPNVDKQLLSYISFKQIFFVYYLNKSFSYILNCKTVLRAHGGLGKIYFNSQEHGMNHLLFLFKA